MRKSVVALLVLWTLGLFAPAYAAPPKYQDSEPDPNETAHHLERVSVTFNEPLDPTVSSLSVSACGHRVDNGTVIFEDANRTMSVELDSTPVGTYTTNYTASGIDDTPAEKENPTKGSFNFSYHEPECDRDDDHKNHNGGNGDHRGDHRNRHDNRHMRGEHGAGGGHTMSHPTDSGHTTADHGAHRGGDERHGKHEMARRGKDAHEKGHHPSRSEREVQRQPQATARTKGTRRSDDGTLNLVLALLLPGAVGAAGGLALRARAPRPA